MSNDAPPQVPPEPRLIDTIRSGGEQGAQLALAEVQREQSRERSVEESRDLLDALREHTVQGQDQVAQEALVQLQTELQNEVQESTPGTLESAGATAGSCLDRTIESAQKLLEEEKKGFSERTPMQNVLRYGVAVAGVAVTIWLWNWIKKKTGKVGATIAAGLLAVGAAMGINKCAERLKGQEEELATSERSTRIAVEPRDVAEGQEALPEQLVAEVSQYTAKDETGKMQKRIGIDLMDLETDERRGARMAFSGTLDVDMMVSNIEGFWSQTAFKALMMAHGDKLEHKDIGAHMTYTEGLVNNDAGVPCRKFEVNTGRGDGLGAKCARDWNLAYSGTILIPEEDFQALLRETWGSEQVIISEARLRQYCPNIPAWIKNPSLALLRDQIPVTPNADAEAAAS